MIALVLVAIGLGLAAAAEYLPWGSVALTRGEVDISSSIGGGSADRVVEVPLTNLSPAHVAVYLITLTATLAALAVVLTATGVGVCRVAAGVTGGLLAANALVLVGLSSVIESVGGSELVLLLGRQDNVSHGPGYLLAYAATLMLAAALAMAVWAPARSLGRRRDEGPEGGEALELSVTPVPPTFQ